MRKYRMGLHTQDERERAYQKALDAFNMAMNVSRKSPALHFFLGYVASIADMAGDQGQTELATAVNRLVDKILAEKEIPAEAFTDMPMTETFPRT